MDFLSQSYRRNLGAKSWSSWRIQSATKSVLSGGFRKLYCSRTSENALGFNLNSCTWNWISRKFSENVPSIKSRTNSAVLYSQKRKLEISQLQNKVQMIKTLSKFVHQSLEKSQIGNAQRVRKIVCDKWGTYKNGRDIHANHLSSTNFDLWKAKMFSDISSTESTPSLQIYPIQNFKIIMYVNFFLKQIKASTSSNCYINFHSSSKYFSIDSFLLYPI